MSQDDRQPGPAVGNGSEPDAVVPSTGTSTQDSLPAGEPSVTTPETPAAGPDGDPDDTVGTGTSIALGCIAGTILLIIVGLIFLGIAALF